MIGLAALGAFAFGAAVGATLPMLARRRAAKPGPSPFDPLLARSGAAGLPVGSAIESDVCILVANLRDFGGMLGTRAPADAMALLNRILPAFAEPVMKRGGVVDKFLGGGVIAIFGAPVAGSQASEKDALAALEAAIEIRDRLVALGTDPAFPLLSAGIGLDCGVTALGNVGTSTRMEFTAIGLTVNTAAALAREDGVLMSGAFRERAGARAAAAAPVGHVVVKGRRDRTAIFRLS